MLNYYQFIGDTPQAMIGDTLWQPQEVRTVTDTQAADLKKNANWIEVVVSPARAETANVPALTIVPPTPTVAADVPPTATPEATPEQPAPAAVIPDPTAVLAAQAETTPVAPTPTPAVAPDTQGG